MRHDVKSLHSGFIFRENTCHLTDGFDIDYGICPSMGQSFFAFKYVN